MQWRWVIVAAAAAFIAAGCATTKQAVEDYKTGATTPLEAGEVSPSESVRPIVDVIRGIPVVGDFAPMIGGAIGALATWRRGRRIRKGKPSSTDPITGYWGRITGIEGLVQNLSNVVAGIFEVGRDGSGFKRAWKVGLSTAMSIGVGALAIPAVRDAVVAHPDVALYISGLAALFGGLEKQVSSVLPVEPAPASAGGSGGGS